MRFKFLLFILTLVSSICSGQIIYAPPVVTIDNTSQKFALTEPPLDEFRMLETVEYPLKIDKTSYSLVISYLDEPITSEEFKEMMESQVSKNIRVNVLVNEMIDDWYLTQFCQSFEKIDDPEITVAWKFS